MWNPSLSLCWGVVRVLARVARRWSTELPLDSCIVVRRLHAEAAIPEQVVRAQLVAHAAEHGPA